MLDTLIIGGGVQGTYVARALVNECGKNPEKIRILDPKKKLMSEWRRRTKNCGMKFMRSPIQQHLDFYPGSLYDFAVFKGRDTEFISDSRRPSLSLFNDHCNQIVSDNSLEELLVRGTAVDIKENRSRSFKIITGNEPINARNIIIALSTNSEVSYPEWSYELSEDSRWFHVFEKDFDIENALLVRGTTYVIGGGITAGQIASTIARYGKSKVVLLHRSPLRRNELDSAPEWVQLEYVAKSLHSLPSSCSREEKIASSRFSGTMPSDVYVEIIKLKNSPRIFEEHEGEIIEAKDTERGIRIRLNYGNKEQKIKYASQIILATGFETPQENGLVKKIGERLGLPMSKKGFPIINDRSLEWTTRISTGEPRIFVAGSYGALSLGPLAGNIAGARIAGQILAGNYTN